MSSLVHTYSPTQPTYVSLFAVLSRACSILRISSRSFEACSYSSAAMASFISRRRRMSCVCCSAPLRAELRHFADVARFAVDVQQQRLELGGEADVVVRAAEAALLAEFEERDAADRAGALVEPGELFGRFADGQVLGQQAGHRGQRLRRHRPTRARGTCGALFAEVELVRLAVHQVGDVERGRLIALLAFHDVVVRRRANQCDAATHLPLQLTFERRRMLSRSASRRRQDPTRLEGF